MTWLGIMLLDDDFNIFPQDINPIIEHNSSHSSHVKDKDLRVHPSQVDKLSHEFDKFKNWHVQENENPNNVVAIEDIKNIITHYDNNISIFRVYHSLLILMLSL